MRLYLKHGERRASPAPVTTNDRTVWLIGIAAWVVALSVVLTTGQPSALWTCVAGLVLGALGLVYTVVRTRRG